MEVQSDVIAAACVDLEPVGEEVHHGCVRVAIVSAATLIQRQSKTGAGRRNARNAFQRDASNAGLESYPIAKIGRGRRRGKLALHHSQPEVNIAQRKSNGAGTAARSVDSDKCAD